MYTNYENVCRFRTKTFVDVERKRLYEYVYRFRTIQGRISYNCSGVAGGREDKGAMPPKILAL